MTVSALNSVVHGLPTSGGVFDCHDWVGVGGAPGV